MLVGRVNLGVALFFVCQKTDLLEPLQFALDIAGVFFNKLRQSTDMSAEIRVFGIYNDDLSPDP